MEGWERKVVVSALQFACSDSVSGNVNTAERNYLKAKPKGRISFDVRNLIKGIQQFLAICWDQWFPEAARGMVLQGAEILLYPTAIGSESQDGGLNSREHWKFLLWLLNELGRR